MNPAVSAVEIERKFDLGSDQPLPALGDLAAVGEVATFELVATYFDTIDFELTSAHKVIRHRLGGCDPGWHAKLAGAGPEQRREFQLPPGAARPPAELRSLLGPTLAGKALFPVAELRTHRVQSELRNAAGELLAYLCDDRVRASAGDVVQTWREAEVELAEGSAEFLEQVSAVFAEAGIGRSGQAAKIGRALGPALAAANRMAAGVPQAGRTVLAYLAVQVGVLQAREPDLLAAAPDAVHRSRVATRRMRSALRTFGPLFAGQSAARLRAELRWHAAALGALRDAEVLRDGLAKAMDELGFPSHAPERTVLGERLGGDSARAHAELVATMATARYDALHQAMMGFLASPPLAPAALEPATAELHGLLDRTRGRVSRTHTDALAAPDDLARWHEVRKAAKAARYCSEALIPVFGARAETHAALWEAVADSLGQVQDSVVARETVTRLAAAQVAAGGEVGGFAALLGYQAERGRAQLAVGRQALEEALAASL